MKPWLFALLLSALATQALALDSGSSLDFAFDGETLNGVLNEPETGVSKGIVLIVHGYGETNAVAGNWYADVRATLLEAGYSTYMWDKIGCGDSTGSFDINQPVESSADEAIAAIQMLKRKGIHGADVLGLWGISRAGWINPLIIKKRKDIAFWISVSGVDAKENFGYLLKQNLIIDGLTELEADRITSEWLAGIRVAHHGGSYSEYKAATTHLSNNPFWLRFTDGGVSWFGYPFYKSDYRDAILDEETGLQVYIESFDELLADIRVPVLALFGEKDMNVDWRKTKDLYQRTWNESQLTVQSFPSCNHNLFQATTGGYYEFQDNKLPWKRCDGFLEATKQWLLRLHTSSEH